MGEQLKKLAKMLRDQADTAKAANTVKCAQVVQASVGLKFLRMKIGR